MHTAPTATPNAAQKALPAALLDGAKIVTRALAHGVVAALALSALTFAIAQRAHATAPGIATSQLAPVNADLSDLYVAAGGTFHRASLVKSHTEVWVDGREAQYKSLRTFDVLHAGNVTLVAPLPRAAIVERVDVASASQRLSATGARNDVGYDEEMLLDGRGNARLTYALGTITPGLVVVEVAWREPMDRDTLVLQVPIKNAREHVVMATESADPGDLGCGDAQEPMSWSVRVAPEWQVDLSAVASSLDHEASAESSWIWSAGNLKDAPTHVTFRIQRKPVALPAPMMASLR